MDTNSSIVKESEKLGFKIHWKHTVVNTNGYKRINSIELMKLSDDGTTVVDGTLNEDISADSPNYSANSFGDGDSGTLYLFVNDNSSAAHSVDLSTFGSGNSLNSNGSGFNLSAVTDGAFSDGTSFDTFKHRTGTYKITAADQRNGWNYARVVHTISSTDRVCNYIEWVKRKNIK